jgi:hypothetical protein
MDVRKDFNSKNQRTLLAINNIDKKILLVLHQQDFKFYITTKANSIYTPN